MSARMILRISSSRGAQSGFTTTMGGVKKLSVKPQRKIRISTHSLGTTKIVK